MKFPLMILVNDFVRILVRMSSIVDEIHNKSSLRATNWSEFSVEIFEKILVGIKIKNHNPY